MATQTYYGELTTVRRADVEIRTLPSQHEVALIGGRWYYLHECPAGTGTLASRTCRGVDYGGNPVHAEREAPADLVGIAAPLRGLPVRASFSAPEYLVA